MKGIKHWMIILLLLLSCSVFSQTTVESSALKASFNYGKSVAVFGGSVSVIPVSDSKGMSKPTYSTDFYFKKMTKKIVNAFSILLSLTLVLLLAIPGNTLF